MSAPPIRRADYAVVGAGPAGLAVAIHAALAGRSAVVLERRAGVLDKACGEGLMPGAVARLEAMGIAIPDGASHPFRGIRYLDGGLVAEAAFVAGAGRGVRRTVLSEAMLRRAAALGVQVWRGVEAGGFTETGHGVVLESAAGPIEARWLVGADGLHGTVRRAPGFSVRRGPRRRFGLRRHVEVPPWTDFVEVHWQDGVEAYVTPVSPGAVGVAFLFTAEEGASIRFEDFLDRFPALAARLGAAWRADAGGAHPDAGPPGGTGGVRGAGPFACTVRPAARGSVLLAGDAAGYVDAITGEGIGLAFAAAEALVRATGRDDGARVYDAALRRLRRRHVLLTRALLAIAEEPGRRRRFIRALSASPRSWRALLALSNGTRGWGRALPALVTLAARVVMPGEGARSPAHAPAARS